MHRWAIPLFVAALVNGCGSPPSACPAAPPPQCTQADAAPCEVGPDVADGAAPEVAVPGIVGPEKRGPFHKPPLTADPGIVIVVPEPVVPEPVVPEPVATPSMTDEELDMFGQELLAALASGSAERFKFSLRDVDAVFAPAYASIVQTGRAAWLAKVEAELAGKAVVFRSVAKGPQFHLGRTGGSASFRQDVPVASDLRIELLVNGNPNTLTVGAMYLVNGQWKVFRADLAE